MSKTVILIAGPTAVGKTSIAIQIAKYFNTEIISADSRQCYKELCIGVARPSEEELKAVIHHFIASHSIQEKVTAATFEKFALQTSKSIFNENDILILAGGTGLYIDAYLNGLDEIPDIPESIREEINEAYNSKGLEWLIGEIKHKDPLYFSQGEIKNPHRLMRALEVLRFTGESILTFKRNLPKKRDFNVIKIALQLPKELLHRNIHTRVDQMIGAGLVSEVKSLAPYKHLNALQTVGYREIFQYLNGEVSLEKAIEEIKKNTRHYAKRQMTWFRKGQDYHWTDPAIESVLNVIEKHLKAS